MNSFSSVRNKLSVIRRICFKPNAKFSTEVTVAGLQAAPERTLMEDEIEAKRNKSRLRSHHYREYHGQTPYEEPMHPSHYTVNYKRMMFGKYGFGSGVDPALCFYTKDEIADMEEYERLSTTSPSSILEIRKEGLERLAYDKDQYRIREERFEEMLAKQEEWKERIQKRLKEKLETAEKEKSKREILLEEVRRHFGYKIDPNDYKFQMMLEQKEKEMAKQKKLEKKKKKEQLFMAKLAALEATSKAPEKGSARGAKKGTKDEDSNKEEDESEQ